MYITVQQKLGHECVDSIVLVKNLKHSIIWVAMKKLHLILAVSSRVTLLM